MHPDDNRAASSPLDREGGNPPVNGGSERSSGDAGAAPAQGPSWEEKQRDEERRASWARTFHDHIAQYLTAMVLGLRALREQCSGLPEPLKTLDAIDRVADEMTRELYRVISQLRDGDEPGSIAEDLTRLTQIWAASGLVQIRTSLFGLERLSLPAVRRDAIVGVVKEAVTNSVRYSGVSTVMVRVSVGRGRLRVVVGDRGKGFPQDGKGTTKSSQLADHGGGQAGGQGGGGHGIRGMHEHAKAVGGVLRIGSAPGRGTIVMLDVPLTGV